MDHGDVLEPKKPWASSGYYVLTLYVSGCVGLDRPPVGGPSGVFLVAKEVGSRGRHAGPEAPEPLEAEGKLCLLVSHPGCDPVRGAVGKAVAREWR
jgi:hypothetical protein